MRRRGKIDANQNVIVRELRQAGFSVLSIADMGSGCPDLLVGKNGRNLLVEVKDASQPPSKQRITDDEREFIGAWRGPIVLATCSKHVIDWFGAQ